MAFAFCFFQINAVYGHRILKYNMPIKVTNTADNPYTHYILQLNLMFG